MSWLNPLEGWGDAPEASFRCTGALEASTAYKGDLFKFHDAARLELGPRFPLTFEDGPWKWQAQHRYAGSHLNCGNFFSLTPAGTLAEMAWYKADLNGKVPLVLDVELGSLLDLRYEENIRWACEQVIITKENARRCSVMALLDQVVDVQTGGNGITDGIGRWAVAQGYDGILFFGARNLTPWRGEIMVGKDEQLGLYIAGMVFTDMRSKPDAVNVVVFSGANLVQCAQRYRAIGKPFERNLFHKASHADLDKIWTYGRDYQEEMAYQVSVVGGPDLVLR